MVVDDAVGLAGTVCCCGGCFEIRVVHSATGWGGGGAVPVVSLEVVLVAAANVDVL